jgi:hypothetical protein
MAIWDNLREVKVKVCGCVPGCVYEGNGRLEFIEYEWNSEKGCIDIRCNFVIEPKYYIPSWILPKGWYIWKKPVDKYFISSERPTFVVTAGGRTYYEVSGDKYELPPHVIGDLPLEYRILNEQDSIFQQSAWSAE